MVPAQKSLSRYATYLPLELNPFLSCWVGDLLSFYIQKVKETAFIKGIILAVYEIEKDVYGRCWLAEDIM